MIRNSDRVRYTGRSQLKLIDCVGTAIDEEFTIQGWRYIMVKFDGTPISEDPKVVNVVNLTVLSA